MDLEPASLLACALVHVLNRSRQAAVATGFMGNRFMATISGHVHHRDWPETENGDLVDR